MGKTKIEWAEDTWNPIVGCSKVSVGCQHCYAERMARRLAAMPKKDNKYVGTVNSKGWTGIVQIDWNELLQPIRWKKSKRIFVCSMGDLFHEHMQEEWISSVFAVITIAQWHTFLILTKRPERMKKYLENKYILTKINEAYQKLDFDAVRNNISNFASRFENIWFGVTAENQRMADERIPILCSIPNIRRFISLEPLLTLVDLVQSQAMDSKKVIGRGQNQFKKSRNKIETNIDWVIVGGESGPKASPTHPAWVRLIRGQCQQAGIPFFFKQWGEWIPSIFASDEVSRKQGSFGTLDILGNWYPLTTTWNGRQGNPEDNYEYSMLKVGKKNAGRLLDGRIWDERPF